MADALLKTREPAFAGGICYHVQQALEKYLKAYLVSRGIDFRRTHNLAELVSLIPDVTIPDFTPVEQDRLSEYAVIARYPGEYESVSIDEADEAFSIARRVRRYFWKRLAED